MLCTEVLPSLSYNFIFTVYFEFQFYVLHFQLKTEGSSHSISTLIPLRQSTTWSNNWWEELIYTVLIWVLYLANASIWMLARIHQFAWVSSRIQCLTSRTSTLVWIKLLDANTSWESFIRSLVPCYLRKETPSWIHSCLPNELRMKLDFTFFLNPTTATYEKIYFTNYIENFLFKMLINTVYVVSVFNLYEYILSHQLNYVPLRLAPQRIFLYKQVPAILCSF